MSQSYVQRPGAISSILIATDDCLSSTGGGVQVCMQDYLHLLQLAGFRVKLHPFKTDQRLITKVRRKLERKPYRRQLPPVLFDGVLARVREEAAEVVFFSLADFPTLAAELRERIPHVKLIHLSFGLDSTDICIGQQIARGAANDFSYDRRAAVDLGAKIQYEADFRRYLDASICLTPLDAELERWLGARETVWFTRPIREAALQAKTVDGRVGCVATLGHLPNRHGLLEFLDALKEDLPKHIRFRLVGSPADEGKYLAGRYSFVEYLGRLSDPDLREEAASWCCFVHPLFHYARGCSTKLAVALGWNLPIATTVSGCRGYLWDERIAPLASSPRELAALARERSVARNFAHFQRETTKIVALQPGSAELASGMRNFILRVLANGSSIAG